MATHPWCVTSRESASGRAIAQPAKQKPIIKNPNGTLSWHISGVIYEGHRSYNIVQAVRADLINDDGTVIDA